MTGMLDKQKNNGIHSEFHCPGQNKAPFIQGVAQTCSTSCCAGKGVGWGGGALAEVADLNLRAESSSLIHLTLRAVTHSKEY
uniref:Uncharacterized protein n=1 Tax=Anguilla anguilla TaxID=7936 RepID=A0A0E9RVS5_ANGAN